MSWTLVIQVMILTAWVAIWISFAVYMSRPEPTHK